MKTDIKALLQTVCSATASLTEDRAVAGEAIEKLLKEGSSIEVREPIYREMMLLGHTISGLHGIAANLRGLLGEPVAPVARKVKGEPPAPKSEIVNPQS